ncbi:MAG TPA: alpha/beta fold hydrolase [Anaerolineales bacterium]|jgi:phospholipase/carboxylesterase|nr:alpha/beta fold hydrolase [Anaerolineales bacterium]
MDNQTEILDIGDWVLRVKEPEGPGPFPVFLLLHGWTGDENSMWIFSPRLPENTLMIAPRGIYSASIGGYSWYVDRHRKRPPSETGQWPHIDDFRHAMDALFEILSLRNFPKADFSKMYTVGFSQGAAFSYALALLNPDRVRSLAGLSGFMPEGAEDLARDHPLAGKSVFITHGTEDDLVPVKMARHAVELLEKAGGKVDYCEENVGHKLSATCFRAMENFFLALFRS